MTRTIIKYYLIMIIRKNGKIHHEMLEFIKEAYRRITVENLQNCNEVLYLETRNFEFEFDEKDNSSSSLIHQDDSEIPKPLNKFPI